MAFTARLVEVDTEPGFITQHRGPTEDEWIPADL